MRCFITVDVLAKATPGTLSRDLVLAQSMLSSRAMNIYQHCNQAGRWYGEAHHAAEDHGTAQYAQFVCHGHHVLHESALQVGERGRA